MKSFQSSLKIILSLVLFIPAAYAQTDNGSRDEMKCSLVTRLFSEGYNQRNLNMLVEIVAVDYIEELNGIESKGLISIIKSVKWLEEIAPDFKISIEDMFCNNDKVVVRWKYEGSDTKYDKLVRLDGIYIALIKDGKISMGWQVFDNYQRFIQLGYSLEAPADSVTGEHRE